MAKRLAAIGITTPLALRDADPHILCQHTSVVMERVELANCKAFPALASWRRSQQPRASCARAALAEP